MNEKDAKDWGEFVRWKRQRAELDKMIEREPVMVEELADLAQRLADGEIDHAHAERLAKSAKSVHRAVLQLQALAQEMGEHNSGLSTCLIMLSTVGHIEPSIFDEVASVLGVWYAEHTLELLAEAPDAYALLAAQGMTQAELEQNLASMVAAREGLKNAKH